MSRRPRTVEEAAALWGCSVETAALFTRKPRAKAATKPPAPARPAQADELAEARARIEDLERQLREVGAKRDELATAVAAFERQAEAHLRRREFRGGRRVRELRQDLRRTRLMLARRQRRPGAGGLKLNLVGGREHLKERLEDLSPVGNPYASIPNKGRG